MFTLKRLFATAVGAVLSLAVTTALASPVPPAAYQEDWEESEGTAGWEPTTEYYCSVTREDESFEGDGNDFLEIDCPEGEGGQYTGPALTGDFGNTVWTFATDLKCFDEDCDAEAWLRFNATVTVGEEEEEEEARWQFTLADEIPDSWMVFFVTFDPGWSDADARLAGWSPVDEGGDPIDAESYDGPSFSATMDDVTSTDVRIWECGECSPPTVGMDNVTLKAGTHVTVPLQTGNNQFDLGFVTVEVNVQDTGTGRETYQYCEAVVPNHLQGKLFPANWLKYTEGTCGEFDIGGWVPATVRFFRDDEDGKLKVGVMRVDSDATYSGVYRQVLTEDLLSRTAPLSCLGEANPADEPQTVVFNLEDSGAVYSNTNGECNQPVSLGRKRSTYLSPVYRVRSVAVAKVIVGGRIAAFYLHLHRADLEPVVKNAILAQVNLAAKNFLKGKYVLLVDNFHEIARIAADADETDDTENWLGLFWGLGLISAFETAEGINRQVDYLIPEDLEPFPVEP
jgi:hypothetical protein